MGHIFTFITVAIWSVAFVSNKALLEYMTPIENMICRFAIAYLLLLIIHPKWQLPKSIKDELYFVLLGFLGIFLYFILENFALKYTQASNVGLFMGAIPIFTALFAHILTHDENISPKLIWAFIISMLGMGMILLEGSRFELRLQGDLLALGGAIVFALYSVVLKLAPKGYHYIVITRKSFIYGLALMLMYYSLYGQNPDYSVLIIPTVMYNLAFLGILSSGLAFILWHQGIERIGSIGASNYIYLVPLLTSVAGIIILDEVLTFQMIGGGVLILLGLHLSQKDAPTKTEKS